MMKDSSGCACIALRSSTMEISESQPDFVQCGGVGELGGNHIQGGSMAAGSFPHCSVSWFADLLGACQGVMRARVFYDERFDND